MVESKESSMTASHECSNCKGRGYVNDIRVAGITHRATTVRRACRPCDGTGMTPQPPATPCVEPEWDRDGDIPSWMLG